MKAIDIATKIFAIIGLCIILAIPCVALWLGMNNNNITEDIKVIIIKNNSTRDYNYEWYCDSIYHANEDYYFDVLMETNEYQNYINKHGQWW